MQHALLGPSSSHKWLHCTKSAREEEKVHEIESEHALRGQLAHEICELKVRKAFLEPMADKVYKASLKVLQSNPLYQEAMLRTSDIYLDYIASVVHSYSSPPHIAIEQRVDYTQYVPEGFGTSDCIIIGGNTMYVIDYKNGSGVPVSAYENSQMKLYAIGALLKYSILYTIEMVIVAIVQPNLDSLSEYEISVTDLLAWCESIKPIARLAFDGKGDFVPGTYCDDGFCKIAATCRARAEKYVELTKLEHSLPPTISNKEVSDILIIAESLVRWIKKLESYALAECLNGNEVPDWKAVAGRSNRAFTDLDKVFEVLKTNGIDEAMLYKKEPITLTGVEELLGKTEFKKLLSTYVNKPEGKPTLVRLSDARQPIKKMSAEDDFKNLIDGGNTNE